jgi:hypothetical protein
LRSAATILLLWYSIWYTGEHARIMVTHRDFTEAIRWVTVIMTYPPSYQTERF